jgi:uncharacterized membrane protein YfhO
LRLEYHAEGWRVRVSGQDRPVTRAEPIFQQVDLPAGQATVEFRFTPPFMKAGYIAFVAGLALLAAGLRGRAPLDSAVRKPL